MNDQDCCAADRCDNQYFSDRESSEWFNGQVHKKGRPQLDGHMQD